MYKLEETSSVTTEQGEYVRPGILTPNLSFNYSPLSVILFIENACLVRRKELEKIVAYNSHLYVYECGDSYYGSSTKVMYKQWNKKAGLTQNPCP